MWTVRVVDANGVTTFIKRGMIRPLALSWAKTLIACPADGQLIILDTIHEYRIIRP